MILVRLALLSVEGGLGPLAGIQLGVSNVVIGPPQKTSTPDLFLLPSQVKFTHRPKRTSDRLVVVPERALLSATHALEHFSNLAAVSLGRNAGISSASPPLALLPETDGDTAYLSEARGFLSNARTGRIAEALHTFDLSAHLKILTKRLDGVAMLAEALAHKHATGRFHELIRVMERGFGLGGHALIAPLAAFLAKAAHQGYTKVEIKRWLEIRDGVTHADRRHSILFQGDVATVVGRLLQAAYEVLLNKRNWRKADNARTERWVMPLGTTSADGDLFATRGVEWRFQMTMLDEFGTFPCNLTGSLKQLPPGWWSAPFFLPGGAEPQGLTSRGNIKVI